MPTARAVMLSDDFGLQNLHETAFEVQSPGRKEVLIRLRAVSLNFRDYLMVAGKYNPNQSLPLVPLSDGIGEVVETGADVGRFEPGDRVLPIFAQGWESGEPTKAKLKTALGGPLDGTLRTHMVLRSGGLVKAPSDLTDVEAATLPCAAVTAWHALFEETPIDSSDTVLCLGTGGVSVFAAKMAHLAGARVIVTSSSDDKLERVQDFGVDHCINYTETRKWGKEAKKLSPSNRGVDRVIEVGGADTLNRSIRATRPGGTICLIGVLSGTTTELDVTKVLMQNIDLQGIIVGHREMFERMNQSIVNTGLTPPVDRVFSFNDYEAAFQYLGRQDHIGKVCIEIDP